jgi:hypothetical protein
VNRNGLHGSTDDDQQEHAETMKEMSTKPDVGDGLQPRLIRDVGRR